MTAPAKNNGAMPPIAILAGGLATRLRPITSTIPKSLIQVAGEPFIAHQLRLLVREGFSEVVLLCGFLGEQIREFVGDGESFGCRVRYSFDGHVLRGTGGALRRAIPMLGEEFMVMYGDSYCPTQYRRVYEAFIESTRLGLMTVFENKDQWDKSNVEFELGEIVNYSKSHSTPNMHFIDYGIGAFKAEAFSEWGEEEIFDLSTVQTKLLAHRQLAGLQVYERFYEIGSHAGLDETDKLLDFKRQTN
jgi:NDP-sugar pyrophosphorylase family protein